MTWTIPLFVWRYERKSKFWNWQHKNFKMNFSDFIWPAVSTCVRSGCSTTSWHHRSNLRMLFVTRSAIAGLATKESVCISVQIAVIALDYRNVDRRSDRHQIEFWLTAVVRICREL